MSRDNFRDYFNRVDQLLENCSNAYVENYSATILTSDRANLKL
jgi:hypothetical protein